MSVKIGMHLKGKEALINGFSKHRKKLLHVKIDEIDNIVNKNSFKLLKVYIDGNI